MTTEKAQSVLMQLVRYHYGLVDVPPTNLEIEEAHYFIRTQLGVAKRFESAIEVKIWNDPYTNVNDIQLEDSNGNWHQPEKYTLYAIPKENE